jgi:uncharacterized protein (DUF2141 family)
VTVTLLAVAVARAATPMAATLRVTVDGLNAAGGTLRVGLYDEPTFPLIGGMPLRSEMVAKASGTVTVTFAGLPPGAYAIKAFQDTNNDGRAEGGEPEGISNGAKPDDFDSAAIVLVPGENKAAIHLH